MDTIILRNKRPAMMTLAQIKDLKGKPVSLKPYGQYGFEAVVPAFVKDHPDVLRMAKIGWLEVAPGPSDGEALSSPSKSAQALGVPPGDGPVVPSDPGVGEPVYLGDPSNPLPTDMTTGDEHVEEQVTPNAGGGTEDQPRPRRKKHDQ
jgi:hypothetical protein